MMSERNGQLIVAIHSALASKILLIVSFAHYSLVAKKPLTASIAFVSATLSEGLIVPDISCSLFR